MKRLTLLSLIVCFALPVLTQGKKPFAIEDLYRLKTVQDPQFSPDGGTIAFTVTESNLNDGTTNSDIYTIRTDGSGLRRMTNFAGSDTHPRWSPDGTEILFVSTRSKSAQAWMIPVTGGEPRQVTDLPYGVGNPVWTPNGKSILFTTDLFPETGADGEINKRIETRMQEGPLQAYMADSLLYRHWTSWKNGASSHILVYTLDTKTVRDLTPGPYDSPMFSLGGIGFTSSPDGQEVCFVSNRNADLALSTNADLWTVPLSGGRAKNITAANMAYDGDPGYSPDGRYLGYRMQTVPGFESDKFRIALLDRTTGKREILTEELDNWAEDFAWSPDSKSIYFMVQSKGHVPLYKVDVGSKKISMVLDAKTIDAFSVSPDGKGLVFARRAVGEPLELWIAGTDGKNLRRLTYMNKGIEETVDIRPAEEIWISSPTGKKIHTFLVTPHNFDPARKYPLILNVHGGPQTQWADAFRGDWQVYPGSGYIVAFPNPHGSTGYGQKFTEAISKDWAGLVYQDIMAVTDSLARLPFVDSSRMGAMGWSYGGYMMMWFEGHTTRFQAIASMMGVYNLKAMHGATEELWFPEWEFKGTPWKNPKLYEKWSPSSLAGKFKTPTYVSHGQLDFRVPVEQGMQLFTALQRQGVESKFMYFPDEGHLVLKPRNSRLWYGEFQRWFEKHLKNR